MISGKSLSGLGIRVIREGDVVVNLEGDISDLYLSEEARVKYGRELDCFFVLNTQAILYLLVPALQETMSSQSKIRVNARDSLQRDHLIGVDENVTDIFVRGRVTS